MADSKKYCQRISDALKENTKFFSVLFESQKSKKDSTNIEDYLLLIESRIIEDINKIISTDKSKNSFKDEKIKEEAIKNIISSINPIIFSSSSDFKKALKKDKKKYALIYNKELWNILSQNGKIKEKSFKFSINSRKELKICSQEIKDPLIFKLNEDLTIDRNNLIEILEIIEQILKKINGIKIEKKMKKYYLMDIKLYEKLKEISILKEIKENQINIDEILELNGNFKPKEYYLNEDKKKIYTYYDEFLLLDDEVLSLLIKLGFNEEDYHPVESFAKNEKEILILERPNKTVQIGKFNELKVFKTNVLIEIEDYSEIFSKTIQEKKVLKYLDNYLENSTDLIFWRFYNLIILLKYI